MKKERHTAVSFLILASTVNMTLATLWPWGTGKKAVDFIDLLNRHKLLLYNC